MEGDPDLPSDAPSGGVVLATADAGEFVGTTSIETIRLRTDFGRLTIPFDEILEIAFPGAGPNDVDEPGTRNGTAIRPGEARVVTIRFTAPGVLERDSFELATPYGSIRVPLQEIRRILIGAGPANGSGPSRNAKGPAPPPQSPGSQP